MGWQDEQHSQQGDGDCKCGVDLQLIRRNRDSREINLYYPLFITTYKTA